MIISKTPIRIAWFGGGSDLPAFYKQDFGASLSVTIDKFIYLMLHYTTNGGLKAKFDTIENVFDITNMKHILTKEILSYYNIETQGLEISSIADVTYNGCGLGTSSAFTVGLINTIMAYLVDDKTFVPASEFLAKKACDIEINQCKFPMGKQDQYAAAYGGFNEFIFYKNEKVEQIPVEMPKRLEEKILLVFSGKSRNANEILKKQAQNMLDYEKYKLVCRNRDRVFTAVNFLRQENYDDFGELLGEAWVDKKQTAQGISDPYFDDLYTTAINNGSLGGKILGAGGGGYMVFYCPTLDVKNNVIYALKKFDKVKPLEYSFTNEGSKIVYRDY